jgi:hypothetical protein
VFCEENYNAFPIWFSFIVIIILNQLNIIKKKFNKDNFGKNHKKNHVGKYCSNSQCFKEKKNYKAKFSISSILKKKIDKDNFRKNI